MNEPFDFQNNEHDEEECNCITCKYLHMKVAEVFEAIESGDADAVLDIIFDVHEDSYNVGYAEALEHSTAVNQALIDATMGQYNSYESYSDLDDSMSEFNINHNDFTIEFTAQKMDEDEYDGSGKWDDRLK